MQLASIRFGPPATSRYWVELVVIALTYFVLAKAGLMLASINPSASPVWPPTGFALAMVLLRGYGVWPAVFIASLIANATTAATLLTAAVIAAGNSLEALVGGYLIQKWCGRKQAFDTPAGVVRFALIGAVPPTVLSATIGVLVLRLSGFVEPSQFGSVWMTWWIGDYTSALLLTPVLVFWAVGGTRTLDRKELRATAMLIATTSAVGLITFSPLVAAGSSKPPIGFLAMVPLLGAALRRGPRDTATAALILVCFAVWGAAVAGGPSTLTVNDAYIRVTVFVICAALPSLALSAEVALRRTVEQRLRESEERLAAALRAGKLGVYDYNPLTGQMKWDSAVRKIWGVPEDETVTLQTFEESLHSDDLASVRIAMQKSFDHRGERHYQAEYRVINRVDGAVRWVLTDGDIAFQENLPCRMVGVVQDVTERKQATEALRASEERFRGIFQNAGTAIAIADLNGGFQSCNPAYVRLLGYSLDELRALTISNLVHPLERNDTLSSVRRLVAQEIPDFEIVNRYISKSEKPIWVHEHISLLRDCAGKPASIILLVTDITERKRHEEQINLLLREVNHRSKNILSIVQSIAWYTAANTPEDFLQRFDERIAALAASQDLLVKQGWNAAPLDDVIRSQLAHFADLIGSRIVFRGPRVLVSASAAQALGMGMHELVTNAGKYGALSNAGGKVEITWELGRDEEDRASFVMTWRESGGPPVAAPSRRGFGSTVTCRMAEASLNAKVDLEFLPSGLVWRLRCFAKDLQA